MNKAETRQFRMHPKLLYDVILRQAGSLSKAILEGVMNAVDAGAAWCKVTVDAKDVMIVDNGRGFRDRDEVTTFFEVFGLPHEDHEKKTYGTFRMGRGQLFAYGVNTWNTREFTMLVDIKNKGLEYKLEQSKKLFKGCQIAVALYEHLLPSTLAETERDIRLWCRWMPIKVEYNGKVVSNDPAACDWTLDTAEAYIELDDRPMLHVYNVGAHVKSFAKHQFGIGGEVVSKQKLQVNFARNDIQSTCPVWKKILPRVDQFARFKMAKKKSLDDAGRQRLADLACQGQTMWPDFIDKALFTAVTGRHYKVDAMNRGYRMKLSVCPKGNRLGDTLHRQRVAFILAEETLTRFHVGSLKELVDLVRDIQQKSYPGQQIAHYRRVWHDVKLVEFDKLIAGMDQKMEVLPAGELRANEKIWLEVIEAIKWSCVLPGEQQYHGKRACARKTVIGYTESRTAGWTDADSYVAINRRWLSKLPMDIRGFTRVALLMLHEYTHNEPDLEDHDHDQDFYERFHDAADSFVSEFAMKFVGKLPAVMERHNRKLTKQQLRQQDQIVAGQRQTEELNRIAART